MSISLGYAVDLAVVVSVKNRMDLKAVLNHNHLEVDGRD